MVSIFEDPKSLFNFVVVDGHGVKGMTDSGVTSIPKPYIQKPTERIPKLTISKDTRGAIDLSGLDGSNHDKIVAEIVNAAKTVGFFQVVNHGLPVELLERVKKAAHGFFEQPTEKKMVYRKGASISPDVVYGTGYAHEKDEVFEWKDYMIIKYNNDQQAMKEWPSCCKEAALEYLKKSMEMLVKRLLRVLIGDLGVPPSDIEPIIDSLTGLKMIKMSYYPASPDPDVTVGVRPHLDMETMTVLLQDGIGGLTVRLGQDSDAGKAGEWIDIPPIPGALVINVGDTMQILSNDRYKSAEHMARTTNTEARVSIPMFTGPDETQKIGPLPQAVEKDGVAHFREVLFGDYKANQGKNSLDFARISNK